MNVDIIKSKNKKVTKQARRKNHLEALERAEGYAKELVARTTKSEAKLIKELELRKIEFKFQQIIIKGKAFYIADFLIGNLIIEIDGSYHSSKVQKIKDEKRTKTLQKWGYKVIRFKNKPTLRNPAKVVNKIITALNDIECMHSFKFVGVDLIECNICSKRYPIDERSGL